METSAALERPPARPLWPALVGLAMFLAIAAIGLWWAKWSPYGHKLSALLTTPHWSGTDMLSEAGAAGSAPSISGAWNFTKAYGTDIWPGYLVALLIASAIDALVPRNWMLGTLRRETDVRSAFAGGVCALPSLMCTCCTAPIAVTLRRDGAPTSAVLAYWAGNPVLNPAVLAFLAIVAPWQWVVTRIVVGAVLVFGATVLVARLAPRDQAPRSAVPPSPPSFELAPAPVHFVRTFGRLCFTLVPLYFVFVFALGLFRGWVFPLDASTAHWVVVGSIFAAAALGTLVVIPTAGEIPILQALAAAGVSAGPIGALLITLPAISLASMAMVVRTLSVRVTVAMAGAVMCCGLLAACLLLLLGS